MTPAQRNAGLEGGSDHARTAPEQAQVQAGTRGLPIAALIQHNVQVLEQGLTLASRLIEHEDGVQLFSRAPEHLAHNGPGSHLRHIHDLYLCFLRDRATGRVDYDRRERDERFEREPAYAARAIERTLAELQSLPREELEAELVVKMDADPADPEPFVASTVERELVFLLSHTIHHYALVALILRAQAFECDAEFGVAPATLEYWKRSGVCAPSLGGSS
jgi:hypothetical protein